MLTMFCQVVEIAGTCPSTLSIDGWHAWFPCCPTAGLHWVFKPSLAIECSQRVVRELEQRPCYNGWPRGSREGWRWCWKMSRSRGHPGLTASAGCSGAGQEPLAFMKPIHCPGSAAAQEQLSNTGAGSTQALPLPLVSLGLIFHHHQLHAGAGVTGHYPAPASISGVIFMKQFPQPPVPLQASMCYHTVIFTTLWKLL